MSVKFDKKNNDNRTKKDEMCRENEDVEKERDKKSHRCTGERGVTDFLFWREKVTFLS